MDILAIGELLIDFTELSKDEFGFPVLEAHPGGAPANFLAAASKMGLDTALIAKVGKDTFGEQLVAILNKMAVDTRYILIDDSVFTTLAFVTLDQNGDRSFSFSRKPGADRMLQVDEVDVNLIDKAKLIHFGTVSMTHNPSRQATRYFIQQAKNKNKLISFDPNLREPLWDNLVEAKEEMIWGITQANIVKISKEEVAFLWDCDEVQGAEILTQQYGCKLAFITLGNEGCYYSTKSIRGRFTNLPKVKVKDTTGAGDIFGGTAIASLLKLNKSIEDLTEKELANIVEIACVTATISTEKLGGITSLL